MHFIRRKTLNWVTQTARSTTGHASYQFNQFNQALCSKTAFSELRALHGVSSKGTFFVSEGKVDGGKDENCQQLSNGQALESEMLNCDNPPPVVNSAIREGETAKIQREFDAARESFQNIPAALRMMPKMDPCGVYANDNLRLNELEVYGFDYDYTLAHYSGNLQTLIYDLAKEHIVKEHRYPESCLQFQYDPEFPIRGLFYDKTNGCLLKLDFFHNIEPDGCYYGRCKMSREEVEQIYGSRHISRDYASNLVGLMDLFCFSEACLISDIIQHFVDERLDFDACYVYEDVKRAIGYVHQSGLVHRRILAEPDRYLVKNAAVLKFLRTLRERGKKLFLLTNSPFYFVDGGMRFMFQDFGVNGDSWLDLFEVVIALSDKPNFYTSDRPFRRYDMEKDIVTFSKVNAFQPHTVYYHGCLKSFLEITKWKGPEVIYFGDHLFSDLRGPTKAGWRTAAIIKELEKEIITQNKDKYRFQQAKFHIVQEFLGKFHALLTKKPREDADNGLLNALNEERQKSRCAMKAMFNPYFGAAFLTDTGRESAFAYNIQRYADVYTSKLENFLNYSSEAWLAPPYDVKIMPHHVKIPSSVLKTKVQQES